MDSPVIGTATQTPAAPEPCAVHELKTLVLSRHPAIAIETAEEERADAQLAAVAVDTGLTVFDWTITHGLVRQPGTQAMYGTRDPMRMLATVGDLGIDGLFVLKDFSGHLAVPAVSRAFRELLEVFATSQRLSTFVLLGASVELPPDVAPQIVRYDLRHPSLDEYRRAIAQVVESLQTNRRAEVDLPAADYDAFATAMTANDLSALPAELLRKGRFDEIFFVDLPDGAERAEILRIHLGLRRQDPADFDLDRIATAADGFSGAELEQVVTASLLRAIQAHSTLDTALVLEEIAVTVPLSRSRREDIARLRALARERFVCVR
jgi:hypothetical protein